jgi:transcriptional pleiotropic regulator of transition state genes
MKSLGIVRKVDQLGRFVFPVELRKIMDISEGTPLEIFVDGDKIVLKKYELSCIFCGNAEDVTIYKGKPICPDCREDLRK